MNDEKILKRTNFPGMDLLKKVVVVCIGVLFILIPVAFIVGIYFFGFASFFSIFGIRVESVGTLLIFVAGDFFAGSVFGYICCSAFPVYLSICVRGVKAFFPADGAGLHLFLVRSSHSERVNDFN